MVPWWRTSRAMGVRMTDEEGNQRAVVGHWCKADTAPTMVTTVRFRSSAVGNRTDRNSASKSRSAGRAGGPGPTPALWRTSSPRFHARRHWQGYGSRRSAAVPRLRLRLGPPVSGTNTCNPAPLVDCACSSGSQGSQEVHGAVDGAPPSPFYLTTPRNSILRPLFVSGRWCLPYAGVEGQAGRAARDLREAPAC